MTQYLFENANVFSVGSISAEEDLHGAPRPGVSINPPPQDGRCEGCQRHMSELPPFGNAEDPFVEDLDGEVLVKTWRRMGPYDAEAEHIFNTFFESCSTKEDRQLAM